jgi:hemerythrin-like metal-binding protein
MNYFDWSDDLSVHNPLIDRDHQELITLVNDLHAAVSLGKEQAIIARVLDSLYNYTQEHFQREELLMEVINYTKIVPHLLQHKKLLERVVCLRNDLKTKPQTVAIETAELLKSWLISHINVSDKELAFAINEAGIKLI